MNCDLDKSDPVARDRYQESRCAIRIGGVGVRERDTPALSPWDPPAAVQPPHPAGTYFALKLAIRLSAIRAVSGKASPCNHGVLAISDAV